MADIEAMFSQVKVPMECRDYQRFLWWPEGDVDRPLEEYRMTVHNFGATSSPSCANYALKRTATDNKEQHSAEVSEVIQHNFYVDDMLKSVSTNEQGMSMSTGLSNTGHNLTGIASQFAMHLGFTCDVISVTHRSD